MNTNDLTQLDEGKRVTFPAVTGTIRRVRVGEDISSLSIDGDDGVHYGIAIEGNSGKVVLQPAKPKNWPPQDGDVWASNLHVTDDVWTADYVVVGRHRSGRRLVNRRRMATEIKSYDQWLKDYPQGTLQYRRNK